MKNTEGGREGVLGLGGRAAKAYWWELDLILTPGDDLMSSLDGGGGQGEDENRMALLVN